MKSSLELADSWGVPFSDPSLLEKALTHRSYVSEHAGQELESNERLEYLGDAVLGLVVSEHLFRTFPDFSEGELSKIKGVAVSEALLHEAGRAAGLGPQLRLSRAEEATGGRERSSILADTFEAVLAAVYLDSGIDAARQFIMRFLAHRIDSIARHEHQQDFKTAFQEFVQAEGLPTPTYRTVAEAGPPHQRVFTAEVRVGRKVHGHGTGRSKKEAEQAAARAALDTCAVRQR